MAERIDDLIKSLKELKEEKISNDEKSMKIFEIFKTEQENFNNSSQIIYEKIDSLKKDINLIDEKRDLFFSKIDSIFTNNLKEDDLDLNENDKISFIKIKRFYKKESLLSELMKKNNYQTIYNIFLSFLLILIAIFTLQGLIEDKFIVNFANFFNHFNGLFDTLKSMIIKQFISVICIFLLNFLIMTIGRDKILKINIFIIGFITVFYFCTFNFLGSKEEFSMIIRIFNYIDNLSSLFKVLSYYFEKILMITYKNSKFSLIQHSENIDKMACIIMDNGQEINIIFKKIMISKEIFNFIYYYYSPTLIYRDSYPLIKRRNYFKILIHLINMLFSIIFIFLIVELGFYPFILDKNFDFLKKDFFRTLTTFCLYSMILLFVVFFGFFHSYFNFIAEIIKFADKDFYSDFFNSLNPNDFMLKLTFYYDDFFEYYISNLFSYFYMPQSFSKIVLYCTCVEYILSSTMNNFCPIIGLTMFFCYLATFPFKIINSTQKQYLNWLFVTFFTGFSFLVLFIEYIFKFNPKIQECDNYIKSYDLNEISKNSFVLWWMIPKILLFIY